MTATAHRSRQCGECGFLPDTVAPGDAAVAIRSFARRSRELLAPDGVPDEEVASYRPTAQEWSALQHVVHLSEALHVARERLARVRTADRPPLEHLQGVSPSRLDDDRNAGMALARLADSCSRFAREIDQTGPEDWQRVGIRGGQAVSALELVREAVHEGAHHLRDVERVVAGGRQALGRPGQSREDA